MNEKKENKTVEEEFTENYCGIIILRKGQYEGKEIWFATVGRQLVSDGAFDTKEQLIKNIEKMTLEKVCKIVAGAFSRAIEMNNLINNEK